MRKLLVVLVLLGGLLVAADRVVLALVEDGIAVQVQAGADLAEKPSVSVRGFPFLTQAAEGRYDEVRLDAQDVDRGGVRLDDLSITAYGAEVPLSAALHDEVESVPVRRLEATALVSAVSLADGSGTSDLSVEVVDGALRVTGEVQVLGATVTAVATSRVRLEGTRIVVSAESLEVQGRSSAALPRALRGALDFRVPVGTLPYGLRLTGVTVVDGGVQVSATSGPTVLPAR